MNRQLYILIILLLTKASFCFSQTLITTDWQKNVCTDYYIDNVYSIFIDNSGNTYTLGSFENQANCLGDSLNENDGIYFLTKQDSNGNKIYVKNFGGNNCFTFGDIKVCNNGDIILGLSFKTDFILNGNSIANSNDWSSIILKVDQNFNLKWFKTFPAKTATYINAIALDEDENIYNSIIFQDSLSINGNIYSQQNGYGNAISKIDSLGNILWSHHYFSDHILTNQIIKYKKKTVGTSLIYLCGSIGGDSIFIDNILQANYNSNFNSQLFVSILDKYGNIINTSCIDDGIRSVADIGFYLDRVFIAGNYVDTVFWNGNFTSPIGYTSLFIGELNNQNDLIGFTDIQSSGNFGLTGFDISQEYGFILSGWFDGNFSLQTSTIVLNNQYYRGSFIASINDTMGLNDCKYIKGGSFNLRRIIAKNLFITGAAVYEQTCNFANDSCFAWNDDILVFHTSDIEQLNNFDPLTYHPSTTILPFSIQVYPNPFKKELTVKLNEKVYPTSILLTNAIGQKITNLKVSQINETEYLLNLSGLSSGLYFISFLTYDNKNIFYKIIKN